MPLLLFGTLLDDELRAIVAGEVLGGRRARVAGQGVFTAAQGDWPVLAPGAQAEGLIVHPSSEAMDRLDYYEAAFGYVREWTKAEVDGATVDAFVYRPTDAQAVSDRPWSLADWQAAWGPLTRKAAVEAMDLYGQIAPGRLAGLMPTIRVRAASALRAGDDPAPVRLRAGYGRDTVAIRASRQPYADFFALRESALTHPTFSGGRSATMERAAFLMCDAVTVLPYDPVRDRVLLVEQFRFGAYSRGDRHPWSLEPVAGRIDAGETPEAAAHREAREEAGLTFSRLVPIATYYPSPGAATEYLYTYVGIAELPDSAAGLGGLEGEGEDIRSHVLTFAELEELIDLGEIDNAPLLVSALWLGPRRATLG